LKPSYQLHFEVLLNFSSSVEGLVQIQDVNLKNVEMEYQIHVKLVHESDGTCF
jgi:hypothetical protein